MVKKDGGHRREVAGIRNEISNGRLRATVLVAANNLECQADFAEFGKSDDGEFNRSRAPVLLKILCKWRLTVFSLMVSSWAMSLFFSPARDEETNLLFAFGEASHGGGEFLRRLVGHGG